MITLCGSTYAKFVCSIILKQPSNIILCSSFIAFKLQAHSILESYFYFIIYKSNFSFILFFFFTILIIPHHPSFFKIKAIKKSTFYSWLKSFRLVRRFYFMERVEGIEPSPPGRKHGILPLNYTRKSFPIIQKNKNNFNKNSQKFQKNILL